MGRERLSQQAFKLAPIDLQNNSGPQAIRTIPELIDYNARFNPDFVFGYQAVKTAGTEDGAELEEDEASSTGSTVSITMRELQGAVAQCMRRLRTIPTIQPPVTAPNDKITKSSAVAILLESDVTLLLHLFALLALGVPVVLLSARLSPVAIDKLLRETNAKHIITSNRLSKAIKPASIGGVVAEIHIATNFQDDLAAASLEEPAECLQISEPSHFTGESDRQVLILHSSGTTGLPKAIYQSHQYFLGYSVCHSRTDAEVVDGLNVSSLPFYHGFGLVAPCLSLGIGKPLWIPPSHVPVTGASIAKALREVSARSLMTVPHILEEMCALPEGDGIAALLPLQFVGSGGGPLKLAVGEQLSAAGVKVLAHFGTTETGPLAPFFVPSPDYDWHFWRLRQDYNIWIEPVDREGSSVDGNQTGQTQYQLRARPFGWDTDFFLQDLLITSKESPGKDFRALGRKDDLIILSTGEKVSPRILESLLCESELVRSAVAFGDDRFELGVIVEPASEPEDLDRFRSQIWPIVEEAGRRMDNHARISSKASIIFTSPGHSLPRSDKGSILRKEVYRMYDAEIKNAYKAIEESASNSLAGSIDFESLETSLTKLVENVVEDILPAGGALQPTEDIFELGANSLHAVRIRRAIRNATKAQKSAALGDSGSTSSSSIDIGVDFVYKNSTVQKMAASLQSMRTGDSKSVSDDGLSDKYVRRYCLPPNNPGHTVLLTGANGSLGSHLLKQLVQMPSVASVICLGRVATSSGAAPKEVRPQHGNPSAIPKGSGVLDAHKNKIVLLRGDPNKPRFALQDDVYSSLCSTVTHILHAAWPMDFQQLLPSFQSQFRFLQNLLQLCRDSHCVRPYLKPRMIFISSIAVVGQYLQSNGSPLVPETTMSDLSSTNDFGYGKAKYICEKIIEDTAKFHHKEMEVAIVRVGQMSGSSESGFWNIKEHFPALVRLSSKVGKFPRLKGVSLLPSAEYIPETLYRVPHTPIEPADSRQSLSWLPVDIAAAVLSEILFSEDQLNLVYHLENPVRQDFETVMSRIVMELDSGSDRPADNATTPCSLVELEDWHEEVSELVADGGDEPDPADATSSSDTLAADEMLSQFFRDDFRRMASGSVILDTFNTRKVSPTLRNATKVSDDTIAKYVQYWRQSGLF